MDALTITPSHVPSSSTSYIWKNTETMHGVTIERPIVYGNEAWTLRTRKERAVGRSASTANYHANRQISNSMNEPANSNVGEPHLRKIEKNPHPTASTTDSTLEEDESSSLASPIPSPHDTHHWAVYVRPANPEDDISHFINHVIFILHSSFARPKRIVAKPPYQVEATGWGEFEIAIIIIFVDPREKPIELYHMLKLFQSDGSLPRKGRSVVSQHSDEIIFTNPSKPFYDILMNYQPKKKQKKRDQVHVENQEKQVVEAISRASDRVKEETSSMLRQYQEIARKVSQLQKVIEELENGNSAI